MKTIAIATIIVAALGLIALDNSVSHHVECIEYTGVEYLDHCERDGQ